MIENGIGDHVAQRKKAFSLLYDSYSSALYGLVLRSFPEEEVAAQILHDSYVQIWNKMEEFDPSKERVYTWMMKIVISECAAVGGIQSKEIIDKLLNHSYLYHPCNRRIKHQ